MTEMIVFEDHLSAAAKDIARGTLRLLGQHNYHGIMELTLANGRRADIAAIGADGTIIIIEIKSSIADFKADTKWPEYQPFCDRFYFAVSHRFPQDLIPEDCGLIIADGFGGAILREPETQKLSGARRKAVTLRFARIAAGRLTEAKIG